MNMSAVLPTYARYDLGFTRGEGVWLFTENEDRYLDFGAGVAVNSLGHSHPHLLAALQEQAEKLWHTSNFYHIPGQEKLAKRLTAASFADLAFFTNSGAEAMECAIKTVRRYHSTNGDTERFRIITFSGAFHGRTMATIAAGGNAKYLDGFGPAVDGFDQVELGDMDAVKNVMGDATAAIMIEPVQGEGGINVVPGDFLRYLRDICDESGSLLVFDEVQTGMGRTGRLFAHEISGVKPDIMALAKGIGGGFPLGACLIGKKAASGMTAGSHGSTYGGGPLAMAVGNAVLDVILKPGFLEHVRDMGRLFRQKLARLEDESRGIITGVRGQGLMLGMQLKIPVGDFIAALHQEHMLAVPAADGVVRLLPPLIVEAGDIAEAAERISRALKTF
jgi:acetylornithine/N-succinyldiaminopimelate aminotransferase